VAVFLLTTYQVWNQSEYKVRGSRRFPAADRG